MRSFTRMCAVVPRIFAWTSSLNSGHDADRADQRATPSVIPTMETMVLNDGAIASFRAQVSEADIDFVGQRRVLLFRPQLREEHHPGWRPDW